MIGFRPYPIMKWIWTFGAPILTAATFLYSLIRFQPPTYNDYEYPWWGVLIGWCLALSSMLVIPAYFIYKMLVTTGSALTRSRSETASWVSLRSPSTLRLAFSTSPLTFFSRSRASSASSRACSRFPLTRDRWLHLSSAVWMSSSVFWRLSPTVNPLVLHAIRIRHQYRICRHRLPGIIRRCNNRIHHLTRIYNHLRVRVAKSKRVYYYWPRKYNHCHRYCWWRRGGHQQKRGDEEEEED